jgi:pimeloyl-ACP methyl ester carboxylesterase
MIHNQVERRGYMPFANAHGNAIHYEVRGTGPPLVLLHGILRSGEQWLRKGYVEPLTRRQTVVTIDSVGHGRSAAPHDPGAYRLSERVEQVLAVLDDIGADRAAIWGYSMGAWTTCGMAARAEDRCTSLIIGAWDPIAGIQTYYSHMRDTLGLPTDTDWHDFFVQRAQASDPDARDVIAGADPHALRLCQTVIEESPGLEDSIEQARLPMLLYCGSADPFHDSMQKVARKAGTRFATISDADHQGAWDQSSKVLAHTIPFLNSLEESSAGDAGTATQ